MAWLKALNPTEVVAELTRRVASLQEQWRGTRHENERLRQEIEQLRQREKQPEARAGAIAPRGREVEAASRTVFSGKTETEPQAFGAQVRHGLWPASSQLFLSRSMK